MTKGTVDSYTTVPFVRGEEVNMDIVLNYWGEFANAR